MKGRGRRAQGPEWKDPPDSLSLPIHLQSQKQSKSTQLLRRICICKSLIVLPPLERIPPGKELWQSCHPTAWVGAYLILEAKEKEAKQFFSISL